MDTVLSTETHWVNLYMAGNIDTAKQIIAQWLYTNPQCVTIAPTTYMYHGGIEEGFVVGFINYPRFPSEPIVLHETASLLADELIEACGQLSYTIQSSHQGTTYVSRKTT